MSAQRAELGRVYRDPVTGFVGTATGRAEYLGENPDVRLTADTGEVGDLKERWISEARVEPYEPPSAGFGR